MSTERKEFESWVARVRLPYCDTPADRAQQWIGWQGCRASPAAAVPEGALPPLPKPDRQSAVTGDRWHSAEAMQAYARAAVEADRARQQQSGHMPPFAAPASQRIAELERAADYLEQYAKYCYEVKPEDIERHPYIPSIEEAAENLRAMIAEASIAAATRCRAEGGDGAPEAGDVSADRAQQGEPVDISGLTRWTFDGGMTAAVAAEGQWVSYSDLEVWSCRAATKAAAPETDSVPIPTHTNMARLMFAMAYNWLKENAPEHLAAAPADAPEAQELRGILKGGKPGPLAWVRLQYPDQPTTNAATAEAWIESGWSVVALDTFAAPVPDTGIPTAGEDERADFEQWLFNDAPKDTYVISAWNAWQERARRAPVSTTPTSGEVEKAESPMQRLRRNDPKFAAHLDRCAEMVATWPAWKRVLWAKPNAAAPSHPSQAKAGEPKQ